MAKRGPWLLVAGAMACQPTGETRSMSRAQSTGASSVSQALPASATWTTVGALKEGRQFQAATLLADGRVLVTGGYDFPDGNLSAAEVYDPMQKKWTTVAPMSGPRFFHAATLLENGKVLVTGGNDGTNNFLSTTELYDPTTNRWSAAAEMHTGHASHVAVRLDDGRVLVTGPAATPLTEPPVTPCELYDPVANEWTIAAQMLQLRGNHTATLLKNGKVFVEGGGDNGGRISGTEIYDPATDRWTSAAQLPQMHEFQAATLLVDGSVLVTGGHDYTGELRTVLRYDPDADSWKSLPPMLDPRLQHTATLLDDGRVLIVGGSGDATDQSTAEIYDPRADRWIATTSLTQGRSGHSALRLHDGTVLATAGWAGATLASTEIYTAGLDPGTCAIGACGGDAGTPRTDAATPYGDGGVFDAGPPRQPADAAAPQDGAVVARDAAAPNDAVVPPPPTSTTGTHAPGVHDVTTQMHTKAPSAEAGLDAGLATSRDAGSCACRAAARRERRDWTALVSGAAFVLMLRLRRLRTSRSPARR
jgi:hypothetical protein